MLIVYLCGYGFIRYHFPSSEANSSGVECLQEMAQMIGCAGISYQHLSIIPGYK